MRAPLTIFAAFLALTHGAVPAQALQREGGPTDCDDVSGVPRFTQINYVSMIQPIFDNECLNCHAGAGGGGAGGLNLALNFSYGQLLTPAPPRAPRVVPGNVQASALFVKINCNSPGGGLSRMPMGGTALSLARQALIADWIAFGAPMLRAGFEDR